MGHRAEALGITEPEVQPHLANKRPSGREGTGWPAVIPSATEAVASRTFPPLQSGYPPLPGASPAIFLALTLFWQRVDMVKEPFQGALRLWAEAWDLQLERRGPGVSWTSPHPREISATLESHTVGRAWSGRDPAHREVGKLRTAAANLQGAGAGLSREGLQQAEACTSQGTQRDAGILLSFVLHALGSLLVWGKKEEEVE